MATASMVDLVKQKNAENPVIVYSKTWCPYCAQVKQLFSQLEVPAKIVELDQVVEGDDVQAALFEVSASRTVPQVFINDQFVGGADDTLMEEHSGALRKRLEEIGIKIKE